MRLPAWLLVARWRVDATMAALWLIVGAVVWTFAVRPLLDHAAEAARQQSELASLGEQHSAAKQQLNDVLKRSAIAKKQLAAATVRPVALSSQNQRQAQITSLAESIGRGRHGGLRMDQLAWSTPVQGPRYTAVGLRIAGSAGYTACRELLRAIHAQFPDTGVVAFKLAGSPDAPGAPATMTLDMVWYAAPPGAMNPPADPRSASPLKSASSTGAASR